MAFNTSDISIYDTVKILCENYIQNTSSKCDKDMSKHLLSGAYNVLIFKDCISIDYSVEELKFALLFRSSEYFGNNENNDGHQKFDQLKVLINNLEKCKSSDDDLENILKFLYLLHIYNNCDQKEFSKMYSGCSAVSFEEINSSCTPYLLEKVPVDKREPLVLNFDLEAKMLMVYDLELGHSYISRENLRQDVKYALIGIQSSSFQLKDSSITLKDGLYTDGIDSKTLAKFLEAVVKSGNYYRELYNICENCDAVCSAVVLTSFKHFLELYTILVDDFPIIPSIISWNRYINPLQQMIETLINLANLLPNSKEFFEKVYCVASKVYLPKNTSLIVNTLLISFSDQYFQIIDEWLFSGSCNNNYIFVMRDPTIPNIDCKESWLKAYIFIKEKAPKFLPCLDIFECGKKVALLKLCSENDPFLLNLLSKDNKRPKIRLCSTLNELKILKETCSNYTLFINSLRENKTNMEEKLGSDIESISFDDIKIGSDKNLSENSVSNSYNLDNESIHIKLEESKFKSDETEFLCESEDGSQYRDAAAKLEFDATNGVDLIEEEMQYIQQLTLKSLDIIRLDNTPLKRNSNKSTEFKEKTDECITNFETDAFLIREIIIKSVIIPLKMQEKLVNQALIYVFLYEKNFLYIAENLTNKFFLIDSNFSVPFIENISISIENETPQTFLNYARIKRLFESITFGSDRNLYFKINHIPDCFDLNNPDVFSCISLTYDIDWPLNLLITPKMIEKYNTVFQFLMSIERVSWKLKYLYRDLKTVKGNHFREIQLHRFVMTQYINMLKSYIHNDVITRNWNKFINSINSIQDLYDLYKNHVEFIKKVRFMCFLSKATIKIREELQRLFTIILKYCRITSIGEWTINENQEFSHSKFSKLKHYFDSFMQLARYITAYLEKIVERQYKSEFDGLLQLLTLNSYYIKK
ncbi:hypothetical protein O3M35_004377 [Rhynocoris fuscipes]|uniref:Gamma-tubulin complex component n=1 Tax=Rhynocoris fuscipes TaxID=488301 RepID=A0AAW1CH01_9HEMI